jgi:predicted transcriptional regulator
MSTINLTLPDALHERVQELAGKNKVSIDLFVATALADKLLMLRTEDNLAERSRKRHVSQVE